MEIEKIERITRSVSEMYQSRGSVIVSKQVYSKPKESIRSHSSLNHAHTYVMCDLFRRLVSEVSSPELLI